MRRRWSLAIAGLILILAGGLLAHLTQTAGGIRIEDVRFKGAKGNTMSALLYIPPNATAQTPAPGILAVHGYINSRETQDGFAIEFARRGYVVLALDQTGHGYSDPPAFANGFGGPDGLAYLRSLDFVDKTNIGLEGPSMGRWTVLAASTAITHPAEHISNEAIGYSLDWFAKTLKGGTPLPADDQIWFRKELGTLLALVGFVALLIGAFDALLEAPMYSRLRLPEIADGTMPEHTAASGRRWTTAFILSAFIPALTYYPAFALGGTFVKPSAFLPQGITNQILVWAVINGLITLALMRFAPKRPSRSGIVLQSAVIAIDSVAIAYAALWLADLAFKIDFRFWIVALKLMSAKQFLIFLIYLVPFTAFFVIALHVLHRNFSTMAAPRGALYLTHVLALTLGFIVLVGGQYAILWLTGKLFNPLPDPGFVPLSTIVAIQFVPLLAICAVIATFTWRRTGSSLPGALICGLFVTWYVVAGTATQAAF